MKTYVTVLISNKERYNHITKHLKKLNIDYVEIKSIDKNSFSDDDIKRICNVNNLQELKPWLTKGNIACLMSKMIAYEEFLKSNEKVALFLEDDVVLPNHIHQILNDIENEISDNELILLDFRTAKTNYKIGVSTINSKKIMGGTLSYPMQLNGLVGSAAFVITRKVAENLLNINKPVLHTAPDSWVYFYSQNVFKIVRILYPSQVRLKPFKSAVNYISYKSILSKIINFIELNRVFPLYQILHFKRMRFNNSVQKSFFLTNEKSPLDKAID